MLFLFCLHAQHFSSHVLRRGGGIRGCFSVLFASAHIRFIRSIHQISFQLHHSKEPEHMVHGHEAAVFGVQRCNDLRKRVSSRPATPFQRQIAVGRG